MNRGLATAILAAGLLISGCSLAGDVTPPPALATAQMAELDVRPTPAPLIPPATQPDLAAGSVRGQVSMGSVGAALPDDLEVSLLGYDGDQEVVNETVALGSDRSFLFEGLEYVPGRLFFATVEHQGLTYRSDLAHAVSDGSALDLPITIYETSQDRSALRVERLHLVFDLPAEDILRVLEMWILANDSDRVLTTPLQIALPEGATNLTFEDGTLGGRYEITGDGFVDLEPIPPGTDIDHLVFSFDLPISRSRNFDQQMLHPVDAVAVLIPADGPRVSGLQDRGVQDVGGLRMQSYATGALASEEPLSFRVSAPSSGSGATATAIVGAGALAIAALVVARFWIGARRSPQAIEHEDLVKAIARLDDDYEAGELSEGEWRRQRDRLKRQALDQMRRIR